jgi:hypothetical protein
MTASKRFWTSSASFGRMIGSELAAKGFLLVVPMRRRNWFRPLQFARI